MTSQEYLSYLRRRLRDVDTMAPLYEDETLLEYTQDALWAFSARKTSGMDGYTVDPAAMAPPYIEPNLATDDGVLLAAKTAALLLRDLYTEKVRSGELGISWESGLERESTIDQRKAFELGVTALECEVEEMILIRASTTSGKRYH